jgi:lysozyme
MPPTQEKDRQIAKIASLVIFLTVSVLGPGTFARPQAPDADKRISREMGRVHDLENEPSRADLFQLIVRAVEADKPEETRHSTEVFNLYGPFTFPNDTVYDVIDKKPRVQSIFGIDISHYTPTEIPLERLYLRNVKFVYMKATQGTGYKDGKFQSFWNRLGKLPAGTEVHRGAYHFLTARGDPYAQANLYLGTVRLSGGLHSTDMPPVVDLEWDVAKVGAADAWAALEPDQILNRVLIWLRTVEANTKRTPIVYTNGVWWKERIGSEAKLSKLGHYNIWIADYSPTDRAIEVPSVPNRAPWSIWQFTAKSRLDTDFTYSLDANVFKGTQEDFYQVLRVAKF